MDKTRRGFAPTRPDRQRADQPVRQRDPCDGPPDQLEPAAEGTGQFSGYIREPAPTKVRVARRRPADGYVLLIAARSAAPRSAEQLVMQGRMLGAASGSLVAQNPGPAVPATLSPGAHLRPIGRLSPIAEQTGAPGLRAVRSGSAYRITSSFQRNLVAPPLAQALEELFERFAINSGFSARDPIAIAFSRGYEDCDRGHGSGLATDIAGVAGRGLGEWKEQWDRAAISAQRQPDRAAARAAMALEARRNLGYRLYCALLEYGGWRVYNNVVQLFGPWTSQLGPWRHLNIAQPNAEQSQLIAEQARIFQAHQDHIHVAR